MKETKFKNTEIGQIPENWEVKKLGAVFDIGNGRDYKHLNTGKIPVYGTGGLMTYVNEYLYDGETVCIGRKGTINMPQYHNGKIWTVDTLFYTYNFRKTDVKFLYYLTQRIDWNSYNTATGVPSLTSQNISNILVSFPPLHEQHRIASALTSIDNLISSLGKLIEKKKNIKQGAMQQLLTGKTRLKGFNEPWMEKKLGDIGSLAMCKRIFQEETSEKGDVPFYKIGTFGQQADAYITKGKYEQFKQMYRFPQKGDVLISAAGTIGRTVIYNGEPAYFQDSNIVWLAHNGKYITNNFLFYIYQRTDWNTEDTTIARLYNNNFNNTCIHFPSSITEQQAIANILSKMDNEITALETKKAKYEAIKQGMMQQLLIGKIRLIS